MNMRTPPALIDEEDKEVPVNNNNNNQGHVGANEVDFSEYLWMADVELEDFDRQVEEELLEEAFIEMCFEQMMAEEEAQNWYYSGQNNAEPSSGLPASTAVIEESLKSLEILDVPRAKEEVVLNSKLNPEAPEFVPRCIKS